MPYSETNVEVRAVGIASAQFTHSMVSGRQYVLRTTTNMWYALGSNPTAAANTTGSNYLAAGDKVLISASGTSVKIAVIRNTADGNATLNFLDPSI